MFSSRLFLVNKFLWPFLRQASLLRPDDLSGGGRLFLVKAEPLPVSLSGWEKKGAPESGGASHLQIEEL